MAPDELQGAILEHVDRLREYSQVKEKMVMILDARGRLKDPNAMDVGYAGVGDEEWGGSWPEEQEVAAVGHGDHCYRCGGMGHMANDCPTPKGKGKGKEDRAFNAKGGKNQQKGKGKGAEGKGSEKGKGKGGVICGYCGKRGHDVARCWTLHPEQLPWKAAGSLDEYYDTQHDGMDGIELSVCCVECDDGGGAWETVARKSGRPSKARALMPPGLALSNRYDGLRVRGQIQDIGGLEVEMPDRSIAGIGREQLKPAGKGKVTIDSGAAESVMPRGMLENEPLVEGEAKRLGVRYVAANGAKMDNYGEKKVRFRKEGLSGVSNMLFQVTDVGKPLASVARILDKGNSVVFSRKPSGSYIVNDQSGRKIPLVEEKGTFVMEVEYLEPGAKEGGFAGQGK